MSAGAKTTKPMIEVRGLVSRFGDKVIHDGLDLVVEKGEVMGVVGGSGAGKTVLLRTLIGLKQPDAGQVKVFGEDVHHVSEERLEAVEQRWGVLFQAGALFTNLTVRENVEAPMHEHARLSKSTIRDLALLKIGYVGLPPGASALKPSELSGGMIKRAGLARALALDPELLFLDEPTSGLDPIAAGDFDALIKTLQKTLGLTVFMVTHDLASLNTVCDRVAALADGKIVAIGPMRELLQSEHPWVRAYFHGKRSQMLQPKAS